VVLAYGAESDRPLNVPGESSSGVFAAREFVWWYNGHPDATQLPVDLSKVETVAICGIGNVALDCARVLLRRPSELAVTDIAAHAMSQLAGGSRVKRVHIFARRGPVQVRMFRQECLRPSAPLVCGCLFRRPTWWVVVRCVSPGWLSC
jgi:adrenodoxin-NADP+ reductase